MQMVELVTLDGSQIVKLPKEFQFQGKSVSIRRQGDAIILEPAKASTWPQGFFDSIFIDDPAFTRPPQGEVPPAPKLD